MVRNNHPLPLFSPAPPNFVTLNFTSFSIGKRGMGAKRSSACDKLLDHLINRFDHVCAQEVKCPTESALQAHYHTLSPEITCHLSPSSTPNSAGVAIFTSKRVLDLFVPTPYYPTGEAMGHNISILFTPKTDLDPHIRNGLSPYRITCVYIGDTNYHVNVRASHINSLTNIPPMKPHLLCGDFNTVFDSEDRSSGRTETSPVVTEAINNIMTHHSLEEIHQPCHTYYSNKEDRLTTSRIDRCYASLDAGLQAVSPPLAFIPSKVPYTLTALPFSSSADSNQIINFLPPQLNGNKFLRITNHIPVAVRFSRPPRGKSYFSTIPRRVLEDPLFHKTIRCLWGVLPLSPNDPFKDSARFKKVVFKAARTVQLAHKQTFHSDHLTKLDRAVRALDAAYNRDCVADDIILAAGQDKEVLNLFDWDAPNIRDLTKRVRDFIHDSIKEDLSPPTHQRPISRVERLAGLLPRLRTKLSFFQVEDEAITDSAQMTAIAHDFWKNKWVKSPPLSLLLLFSPTTTNIRTNPSASSTWSLLKGLFLSPITLPRVPMVSLSQSIEK